MAGKVYVLFGYDIEPEDLFEYGETTQWFCSVHSTKEKANAALQEAIKLSMQLVLKEIERNIKEVGLKRINKDCLKQKEKFEEILSTETGFESVLPIIEISGNTTSYDIEEYDLD